MKKYVVCLLLFTLLISGCHQQTNDPSLEAPATETIQCNCIMGDPSMVYLYGNKFYYGCGSRIYTATLDDRLEPTLLTEGYIRDQYGSWLLLHDGKAIDLKTHKVRQVYKLAEDRFVSTHYYAEGQLIVFCYTADSDEAGIQSNTRDYSALVINMDTLETREIPFSAEGTVTAFLMDGDEVYYIRRAGEYYALFRNTNTGSQEELLLSNVSSTDRLPKQGDRLLCISMNNNATVLHPDTGKTEKAEISYENEPEFSVENQIHTFAIGDRTESVDLQNYYLAGPVRRQANEYGAVLINYNSTVAVCWETGEIYMRPHC